MEWPYYDVEAVTEVWQPAARDGLKAAASR